MISPITIITPHSIKELLLSLRIANTPIRQRFIYSTGTSASRLPCAREVPRVTTTAAARRSEARSLLPRAREFRSCSLSDTGNRRLLRAAGQ